MTKDLERRTQELGCRIASDKQEQKAAQQELRKLHRARASRDRFSREVALVLLARAAPEKDVAVQYLASRGVSDTANVLNIIATLQDKILDMPVDGLAQILDGQGMPRTVMREAQRYEQEVALHHWVRIQNVEKGVAPETNLTLRHMKDNSNAYSSLGNTPWRGRSYAAGRKWLQRFRRRWRMTLGRYPSRERLSPELMREKASPTSVLGVLGGGRQVQHRRPSGPKTELVYRTPFWARY